MLDQALIQREYGFLGDHIFLNVSQVVMPPKRVQDAYNSFMARTLFPRPGPLWTRPGRTWQSW